MLLGNSIKNIEAYIYHAEKFSALKPPQQMNLIINLQMNKGLTLVGLSLLVTIVSAGVAPCPLQYQIGSLVSARVIVAQQQSLVPLTPNTDTQCYNYSLPYSFASVPEIAIAVHDFESRTTNELFFSIKPIESESLGYVPFLIRTQWRYTYWNKIVFSFLAEDRKDLEAGYYQVDSGSLGGCEPGKSIQVLLPFRRLGLQPGKINHNLFLHGFEISAQKYGDNSYSPFEIQIVQSNTNSSGIAVLITTTTITQVSSLHISYLAWVDTSLNIIAGVYNYDYAPGVGLSHTPIHNIGRNYARLHGLTGFIITHNFQALSFATEWTGTKFNFNLGTSQNLIQYMTFQYVFFIGSECSDCPGYPYVYDGKCQSVCPPGSFPTRENTCIKCGENYYFDGSACKKLCPQGQVLNEAINECECPQGMSWTGTNCISCTSGRVFDSASKSCRCPSNTQWNGITCASVTNCTNGKEFSIFTFTCECPIGTVWNGTYCTRITRCNGGQILNSKNECVCPDGTYLNGGYCQPTGCSGGQQWDGKSCVCPKGLNFNGTYCLECINGQIWNPITRTCLCPANYTWNGNFCEKYLICTGKRIYNREYDRCLCPEGQFWNGAECKSRPDCCCGQIFNETSFQCNCPQGFNFDGNKCVLCLNGKNYNSRSRTCECPAGTQWNGQFCAIIQSCFGGMLWNQNTWACECPSTTVWKESYCVANPCTGGQVWDQSLRRCICVGGRVFVNGFCETPDKLCTYGRVWSPTENRCKCPQGKFDTGSSCENIISCQSNQIYNPLNNKCVCPPNLIWLSSKNQCGDPTCPIGQYWDGFGCVTISCPPGSFYNGTECICPEQTPQCLPWEFYDGNQCVYYRDTCPLGTRWDQSNCVPTNKCPVGFYGENNQCKPFPQKCIPPTVYNDGKCLVNGNNCPMNTYYQGGSCNPYASCQNGQTWDSNYLQCVCPQGTGWNGNQCVNCAGGQIWTEREGCQCPEGSFFVGSNCEKPDKSRCNNIPNAYWSAAQNVCLCDPGFVVSGYSCVCKGVPYDHFCDRCSHLPNSEWRFGICQCKNGYTLYGNQCLPNLNNGTDTPADCGVGTYFDTLQKKCLSCPDGCLSCTDCYTCQSCDLPFTINRVSNLCEENCGDGKRFIVECDDGNNNDGDGCSRSCQIEDTYTCRGGSPSTPDSCVVYKPTDVTITQTGQIRYSTRIVVNIKIDYLPKELLQSTDCNDRCSSVIEAKITGDSQPVSIKSNYLPGSRYVFSVDIEFGRAYISKFNLSVSVNQSLRRYFSGVNVGSQSFQINPAYLSLAGSKGGKQLLD